jgi:hypothetical protein
VTVQSAGPNGIYGAEHQAEAVPVFAFVEPTVCDCVRRERIRSRFQNDQPVVDEDPVDRDAHTFRIVQ